LNSWEKAVKKKYGIIAQHLTISKSSWILETWNKNQYPELTNDKHLLSKLNKLHQELPKKSEGPDTQQLILGKSKFIAQRKGNNILTLLGMNEMAKRATGETSTINSHHRIGIGTTTENTADTELELEEGSLTIGSADVINQTERYATAFADTDVTSPLPINITEAGIFTAETLGILIMRITFIPIILDVEKIITIQTNVTHENGIDF